ncbi:MAG: hypothetical protein AUK63_665 [bacterium P3]|nr:MAG: hypothetical protein AUK63_665 [bacterium P3]KWW42148.1 MAG: hypothetical protein F083_487 [bacterium F083]
MKHLKLTGLISLLIVAATSFTACERNDDDDNVVDVERVIVYTVDGSESKSTLNSESEWDRMLNQFCNLAQTGQTVIFYNISSQPARTQKGSAASKEVVNYTTTDREEMKAWMKRMEHAGKTVRVVYDDRTGTWRGTAYVNMPGGNRQNPSYTGQLCYIDMPPIDGLVVPGLQVAALKINEDSTLLILRNNLILGVIEDLDGNYHEGDRATLCGELKNVDDVLILDITDNSGLIAGTWQYCCISTTTVNGSGTPGATLVRRPDDGITAYEFREDGTVSLTTPGDAAQGVEGTWSWGEEGELCCELLPMGGGCWSVNWLSGQTMILSRMSYGTEAGDIFYQIQFEKIAE